MIHKKDVMCKFVFVCVCVCCQFDMLFRAAGVTCLTSRETI